MSPKKHIYDRDHNISILELERKIKKDSVLTKAGSGAAATGSSTMPPASSAKSGLSGQATGSFSTALMPTFSAAANGPDKKKKKNKRRKETA
jgi:hypothetical protein